MLELMIKIKILFDAGIMVVHGKMIMRKMINLIWLRPWNQQKNLFSLT